MEETLQRLKEVEPINMNVAELKAATRPLGKAIVKGKGAVVENPKYKYAVCEICNRKYCVKNSGKHRSTQYHIICSQLNKRLKNLILGGDNIN